MKCLIVAALLSGIFVPSPVYAQLTPIAADPAVEAAVMQVLNNFMESTNRLDVVAMDRTLQFPHYRLASGRMVVLEKPGLVTAEQLRSGLGPEWDHSAWSRLR